MLAKLREPDFYGRERAAFTAWSRTDSYAWVERSLPVVADNIRRMHAAGIKLGIGTDAGGPVGYNIQGYDTPWEMRLMTECGLSPMAAIVAATRSNAEIMGVADRLGTVEPGKAADILVLSENPLDRITNIRKIDWIIQDGVVYPRDHFRAS
jgi:imidazolonepropionase-like amidohydrolase